MHPFGEASHVLGEASPDGIGEEMIYLNFNQLSEKLGGRSRSSLYRDIESGRIPEPIRIGGRLYWIESQVDETLATKQQEAA